MLYEVDPPLTSECLQSILQDVQNSFPASEFSLRNYFWVSIRLRCQKKTD